jgi:tetratricopeptide (TPR) repeat protein
MRTTIAGAIAIAIAAAAIMAFARAETTQLQQKTPDTKTEQPQSESSKSFYPSNTADKIEILKLLKDRKYEELNNSLAVLQNDFEKDVRNEYILFDSFDVFNASDSYIERFLEDWLSRSSEQCAPYIARALHWYAKGWNARGQQWASETSERQFRQMDQFFGMAEQDIQAALVINPKALSAHWMRINISNAIGEKEATKDALEKSMSIKPESLILRAAYMNSLLPRWGGSYSEMEQFASQSETFLSQNPSLAILRGYIDWDKGRILEKDDKYDAALAAYTKALTFGEYPLFLADRAETYYDLHKQNLALQDINRALAIRPQYVKAIACRGALNAAAGRFDEAQKDFKLAESIDNEDSELLRWRKHAADVTIKRGYDLAKTNRIKAGEFFNEAIYLNPNYWKSYYYSSWNYLAVNDLENALSKLKDSILLNPHYLDSYLMLDNILARQNRWDEIIPYWDQFIALEPSNARAYLERGGTYYRKGDIPSAVKDAKRACELKNEEACRRYQQLRWSLPE